VIGTTLGRRLTLDDVFGPGPEVSWTFTSPRDGDPVRTLTIRTSSKGLWTVRSDLFSLGDEPGDSPSRDDGEAYLATLGIKSSYKVDLCPRLRSRLECLLLALSILAAELVAEVCETFAALAAAALTNALTAIEAFREALKRLRSPASPDDRRMSLRELAAQLCAPLVEASGGGAGAFTLRI
jgi:hypothetical protein